MIEEDDIDSRQVVVMAIMSGLYPPLINLKGIKGESHH